ncbi:MAG: exostosin family protein [Candidatus Peribacteraceae bacterium]|nr:exostosin family protein [Candidatus Peribacteraceae bacterium]
MRRVFIDRIPGLPVVPLLYPTLGREERGSIMFLNEAFAGLTEPFVEVVSDPAQADDLLVPHNFPSVRHRSDYLRKYAALGQRLGKRIIVIAHGDSDAPVRLPHATVFRTSMYRFRKQPHEIAMPAYAVDLLREGQITLRKKSDVPTVGFCGWTYFKNPKNAVATFVKDALVGARAFLARDARIGARKKGLTFRRAAVSVLRKSPVVRTNFLLRSSYSGHLQTIRLDPVQAREEYRRNLLDCDLALAIKGDGNYSYRFYEALSLGRVPLFLDTECVLPLEDHLDYSSFIVRVPLSDLPRIDQVAAAFWRDLTEERFADRQRRAREAFEKFLSVKAFFRFAVERLL